MCHMARADKVCEECHTNCLLLHRGKHDQPCKVLKFFKVMFGKNFSNLLILPPTISRELSSLEGKNSWIEDSMGKKWKVVLSDVEGSLAFKKGWDKFFLGRKIEQGDLLTFHYIRESHFHVTIYGKSGGEKPFPVERRYQNKRPKTATHSITKNDSLNSFHDERQSPLKNNSFNTSAIPQSDTDSIMSKDNMNNVNKSPVEAAPAGNISKAEYLLEPNFLNDKETTFAREDDREHLFDLSVFELPDMKPCNAMQDDRDHLIDHPTFNMVNKNVDDSEDHRAYLIDTPFSELPDVNTSFTNQDDINYFADLSTSKMADKNIDDSYNNELQVEENTCSQVFGALQEVQAVDASPIGKESTSKLADKNVDANHIGEFQAQGHTCSQVMGALHNVQAGNASIDAKKSGLSQANSVLPEKKTDANLPNSECIPAPSVSPGVYMPQNSSLPLKSVKKVETFEASTASKYSRLPAPSVSPGVDMPQNTSLPLKSIKKVETFEASTASKYSRLPGGKLRAVKQEPREFGQALFNNVVHDTPFGANLNSMEDKVQVIPIVKPEPIDFCDSDSEPTIRITCSIPPDSESFLVLPEPLPLKRGQGKKLRQKLILLRNSSGTDWPVIYHNTYHKVLASGWKAFRKANKICSGHVCSFVLNDLEKGIFCVETSRIQDC